jgi:membrane dipeptidase
MFCCLGPPISAAAPAASGSAKTTRQPGWERGAALAREQVWMDAHAHPGRSFLVGLGPENPLVRVLGAPDPERALADLAAGGVRLAAFATVGDLGALTLTDAGIRAARDFEPGEAAADHLRQLEAIVGLAEGARHGIVRSAADLRPASADGVGILVACEGADFLEGRLEGVEEVHGRGARSITLVHYRVNELGDIQTEAPVHDGLTPFGADVVAEMNRLGMVIDLAHATWEVTKDVLDRTAAPVMISHSHLARGEESHPRLLSAEHALAVTRAGGVVAAWPSGVALGSFDEFLDEILRMVELLGVDHVAIGTDMDANFRPVVTSHRQYPDLAAGLLTRGMSEAEVGAVLGGNLVGLFAGVLS